MGFFRCLMFYLSVRRKCAKGFGGKDDQIHPRSVDSHKRVGIVIFLGCRT